MEKEELKLNEKIEKLALEASELYIEIEKTEKKLEEDQKKYNELVTKELPDLLENQGLTIGSKLVLNNGLVLTLKDFFSCSIPSESSIEKAKDIDKKQELLERRADAIKWLVDNNLKDIIKDFIDININKDPELKEKVLAWAKENNLNYTHDETVHPQTLKATLKDQMQQGKEIPFEIFDIVTGCVASFERKK